MFITNDPSPSMSITVASGRAAHAPIAAGKPNPIDPKPPDVSQFRGSSNL
jgi:hypothetical protein